MERQSRLIAGLVKRRRRLESAFPESARFFRFGAVGASGVAIDLAATASSSLLLHPDVAYVLGIGTAMTWNFFWNRRITFADARPQPLWRQYSGFCASCSIGALANWTTRTLLRRHVELFARQFVLAVPVGVVAGMAFNYLLCRRFVFRTEDRDGACPPHEPNTPGH